MPGAEVQEREPAPEPVRVVLEQARVPVQALVPEQGAVAQE